MAKIDLKKELKHLYDASAKTVTTVEVPAMNFLMINGQGNPNTAQTYKDAISTLYTLSYTLKFKVKKSAAGVDYGVMLLEGLWWTPDLAHLNDKEQWIWTVMIMQPEFVTPELVSQALVEAQAKKKLAALEQVRLENFHEGLAAQVLHIGPYAAEAPTIARLHAFIEEHGYAPRGRHHEIYVGDPQKAAPEKLKTIVRQPVAKVQP
ncbi:MAG: hypothetical protein EXR62_05395 [Chloroflexi bacterium]|nr:hypothetical protein [Chloroflexota bacterium]